MDRSWISLLWITGTLWFTLADIRTIHADGFRSPFQDSAAIAQGNAFRAQADNPSAVFYNPAGMTQLSGIQHSFGIQFVNVDTQFQGFSGNSVTNDMGGLVGLPPPGQFFLTGNLNSVNFPVLRNITLGLGVLSLYGFSTKYPKKWAVCNSDYKSAITIAGYKTNYCL